MDFTEPDLSSSLLDIPREVTDQNPNKRENSTNNTIKPGVVNVICNKTHVFVYCFYPCIECNANVLYYVRVVR